MTRSIASRWADLTEPATPNSCLRSPKGINAYRARLAGMATEGRHDVPTVSSQMGCVFHGCLQRRYSTSHHLLPAFPEGDKRLIGHGWPEWRPKGGMTCLPCLRSRRMDELCRSSTAVRNLQRSPPTSIIENVELLQSSYTSHTTVRQGSRFAPTLPYQAFNPFGVGTAPLPLLCRPARQDNTARVRNDMRRHKSFFLNTEYTDFTDLPSGTP